MWETLKHEWSAQCALVLFIFFTIFYGINTVLLPHDHIFYQIFAATYGIIALWGAIWGIITANKWGGLKSVMGKSLMLFSIGLLFQEFGQIVYSLYIYLLQIEVPYPSVGDIGYFGSIPLYIAAVYFLGKASGVKLKNSDLMSKVVAIVIPLIMLGVSYLLFLKDYTFDWANPLAIFLDFGYPMGQAIYVSLAILTYILSRKVLGGMMKQKILFILFALVIQYLADYTFLYQAHQGTWFAGGLNDYLYLVSYFLMTFGLIQFNTVLRKLRVK